MPEHDLPTDDRNPDRAAGHTDHGPDNEQEPAHQDHPDHDHDHGDHDHGPTPILISLAPAALDLPNLLRAAIDAEKVGAARIHLPTGIDLDPAIEGLRAHTGLVITAETQHPKVDAVATETKKVEQGDVVFAAQTFGTPNGAGWFELIFDPSMTAKQLVLQVGVMATRFEAPVTVAGSGAAAMAVQLAAVAAGFHCRVGSAHTTLVAGQTPRDDSGLVARVAGIARLAGRTPMTPTQAREFLGLT